MSRLFQFTCIAIVSLLCLSHVQSDAAAPPPFTSPPPNQLSPQQRAAVDRVKTQIQILVDQMDIDLEQKRRADYLAHRDPMFAITNAHDAWRSATNCRADAAHLFDTLISADRRSVVHTVTLNGRYAEAFISRHGTVITDDTSSRRPRKTLVNSVSREVFEWHGNHWMQYRAYTLAEQVVVDGKAVSD